jgi:hypothetical protein
MADSQIVPIHRGELAVYQVVHQVADMTDIAAKAQIETAKEMYGVPARQDTIKTTFIGLCIVGLTILGVYAVPASEISGIIKTALIVVGGAWGATEAIKRWRRSP